MNPPGFAGDLTVAVCQEYRWASALLFLCKKEKKVNPDL